MLGSRSLTLVCAALATSMSACLPATGTSAAYGANAPFRPANHGTATPAELNDAAMSPNWSGYVVTGGRPDSVSASWVQPAVSCGFAPTFSVFWVGLDGYGSSSVEQTGTGAVCIAGLPWYYAWTEMYPELSVPILHTIRPGDLLSASVTTDGIGHFTLALTDATRHWSNITTRTLPTAHLASAEIIAEAPLGIGVLPLADFRTITFYNATANGQPIASQNPRQVTIATGPTTKAIPSPLFAGSDFSVAWKHS